MSAYRRASALLAATVVALGVAMIAVTAARGGGQTGFVLGALFVAAGTARLYLQRRV
jgi:hypothetical protein